MEGGGKTEMIRSGGKFRQILNSSEMLSYGGDTKFTHTTYQWIEAEAAKVRKYIHHNICGHGGERRVMIWYLDFIGQNTPAYFSVDDYQPKTDTVYHFQGCHCHRHTCMENFTKRQKMRYKDTCQIDRVIANNGRDTKYNLVSI